MRGADQHGVDCGWGVAVSGGETGRLEVTLPKHPAHGRFVRAAPHDGAPFYLTFRFSEPGVVDKATLCERVLDVTNRQVTAEHILDFRDGLLAIYFPPTFL